MNTICAAWIIGGFILWASPKFERPVEAVISMSMIIAVTVIAIII